MYIGPRLSCDLKKRSPSYHFMSACDFSRAGLNKNQHPVSVESKVGFYTMICWCLPGTATCLQCFRAPLWIMFLACFIQCAAIYGLSLLYTCSGRVEIRFSLFLFWSNTTGYRTGCATSGCSCVALGLKGSFGVLTVTKLEDHRRFWTEEVVWRWSRGGWECVGWWILLLGKSRKYKQKHWNVKRSFLNKK